MSVDFVAAHMKMLSRQKLKANPKISSFGGLY